MRFGTSSHKGATVIGLLMMGLLSACGTASTTNTTSPATNSGNSGAFHAPGSASVTTTTVPVAAYVHSWNWTVDLQSGYKFSGVIEAALPEHISDARAVAPGVDAQSIISSCSPNPESDAVVPLYGTVVNNTPNFSTSIEFELGLSILSSWDRNPGYQDVATSSGCIQMGDGGVGVGAWATSSANLGPNSFAEYYGYLIIPNYYTPAAPNGSQSVFAQDAIDIQQVVSGESITSMTVTGPGVPTASSPIPLDGITFQSGL